MPTIKPIPKSVLIHTVEYLKYLDSGDGWSKGSFAPGLTIKNVRFEPSSKLTTSTTGKEIQAKGMLVIDYTNSSAFPEIKEQSIIKWKNEDYTVNSVKTFYGFLEDPHHKEVELI